MQRRSRIWELKGIWPPLRRNQKKILLQLNYPAVGLGLAWHTRGGRRGHGVRVLKKIRPIRILLGALASQTIYPMNIMQASQARAGIILSIVIPKNS